MPQERSRKLAVPTVGSQVTIKRKHRQLASGHTRWWFVLRGEEEVLTQLEGEWERVAWATASMEIRTMLHA